jgi:putative spermidine/putrescine transport system permease protein
MLMMTSRRRSKKPSFHLLIFWVLFAFLLAFIALFELFPIVSVAKLSFLDKSGELTLQNYTLVFQDAFLRQSIWKSIEISFYSSFVAIIISVVFCNSLRRVNSKMRDWILSFYNLSSNFTGVPLAFAFIIILGFNGAITLLMIKLGLVDSFNLYSKTGIILIYIYFQIPLAVLMLYPVYDHLDPRWREAAYLLGAGKFSYWMKIGLPALMESILSTFVLLFANAIGAYATVYALMSGNYNLIPIRISGYISSDVFYNPNLASALSVIMVMILVLIATLNFKVLSRRKYL